MNEPVENEALFSFQSTFLPISSSPTTMPESDEQTNERPLPAPSIQNRLAPSYDYAEKGFRRFYNRSIDSSAAGSNDSSPTTTISTVDDSSATEPSPGSSPESPPPNTLAGDMLRPRTADDVRAFFELPKQPLPKKGRNLKNLAVNTSRNPGKASSTASLPLPTSTAEVFPSDSSTFVKPQTPSKRKPSTLGLTLLTPGPSKAPPTEIKLAIPPTPSFNRPGTLRHFQSSPLLPLIPAREFEVDLGRSNAFQPSTLETILSPTRSTNYEDEDEQNFDVPLSKEDKPQAYPDGPICVYDPHIDLYLEPTVDQAREYDVIMNVASEVRNPFFAATSEPTDEPEIRIDGGGGIQYAPKRDRIVDTILNNALPADGSPTTPKATPLESEFSKSETSLPSGKEPEYIHIKWEHNSDIVPDLLDLVKLMDEKVMEGKRVLIHCQCGVSRSASLVVAYGLYKDPTLSVQEAYDAVKARSKWIGPNMNLIMQLQEFRTSLMRGGLLSSNRGVTPITPSSALSEWGGPFATPSISQGSSQATLTATLARSQTPEPLPVIISGPSSAPSHTTLMPVDHTPLQRARAVSAGKPGTAYVNPSGRVVPAVPVLKVSEPVGRAPTSVPEKPGPINGEQASTRENPPELVKKPSTDDFAMTPLQPSPEVDPADSFGLMSPTSTEFSSSPFDRSFLLAKLGMGPVGQQEDLTPRRSISLRSQRHLQPTADASTVNGSTAGGARLRSKISSPDLREQRHLQHLQARIEASLPNRAAPFGSAGSGGGGSMANEALMSPRATEFTQNPFALAMEKAVESVPTPTSSDSDPRSPAQKCGSPITRNILDVL